VQESVAPSRTTTWLALVPPKVTRVSPSTKPRPVRITVAPPRALPEPGVSDVSSIAGR
jgi:hypothetical protein